VLTPACAVCTLFEGRGERGEGRGGEEEEKRRRKVYRQVEEYERKTCMVSLLRWMSRVKKVEVESSCLDLAIFKLTHPCR
jgi:hypothetical protein